MTRSARGSHPSGFIADNWDSTAAIEGWGVGVTAASAGASFGGMLVGGGANVVTSFGLNALMGDPFAGSASRTATGAIGQRVAGVKGGGNGGNAVGQNRGEPAAVRMGGPGGQRPSLFDPEAGALACNAGGDVCIELLRQQRDAQWKIAQENIKAVEDAEWELFWAYTGAQAVKLARWAWVGVKAWRAARAAEAAARAFPILAESTGGKMLGEAVGYLRRMPGAQRAAAFEKFAEQITRATNGQWSAKAFNATNARVFAGEGGEALVFDGAGNMFRGHLSDRAAFAFRDGGQIEVIFSALRGL